MKKHLPLSFTALGLAMVMGFGAPMSASASIDRSELAEGDTLIMFDCEYDFPYALGIIDISGRTRPLRLSEIVLRAMTVSLSRRGITQRKPHWLPTGICPQALSQRWIWRPGLQQP